MKAALSGCEMRSPVGITGLAEEAIGAPEYVMGRGRM